MALFHRATITPTKLDLIAEWAPTQPWGPSPTDDLEAIGAFRFDDPDGRVGMAVDDGRWSIAPSNVRIHGGGWTQERVPVDGFELGCDDAAASVLRNDRFELTVHRRPVVGPRPAMGLTATWPGQEDPVVLAAVRER